MDSILLYSQTLWEDGLNIQCHVVSQLAILMHDRQKATHYFRNIPLVLPTSLQLDSGAWSV